MNSAAWAALLRRIPPDQHDKLMLVTTVGQEITLYAFLDLAEDYMAVRGRLAGTTDAGRVFFVPYDQINYFGFLKEIKESRFREMFGLSEPPGVQAKAAPVDEPVSQDHPAEELVAVTLEPLSSPEVEAAAEGPRSTMPGKAALLERLRARAKAGAARPPVTP